jgi:hypothetical protein
MDGRPSWPGEGNAEPTTDGRPSRPGEGDIEPPTIDSMFATTRHSTTTVSDANHAERERGGCA